MYCVAIVFFFCVCGNYFTGNPTAAAQTIGGLLPWTRTRRYHNYNPRNLRKPSNFARPAPHAPYGLQRARIRRSAVREQNSVTPYSTPPTEYSRMPPQGCKMARVGSPRILKAAKGSPNASQNAPKKHPKSASLSRSVSKGASGTPSPPKYLHF